MSTVADASSPPHPLGPRRQPGMSIVADAGFPPRALGFRHQPGASTVPASRPPFPIYVLDYVVDMADLTGKPELGWWEIPCASRRAYGRGNNIQEALEGLTLYACLGDGPLLNSSLAIRMSEGALRKFESELDPDYYSQRDPLLRSDLIAQADVEMAEEQGVTVIVLSITRPEFIYCQPHLLYYLVYDSTDRSLSMFQILPDTHAHEGVCTLKSVCTMRPIIPKRTGGGGSDYKMLLLSYDEDRSSSHKDVLWVGSLSSSGGTEVPSKLKSMEFPKGLFHKPFNVDVAFSFQGKGFWGDLKQGLLLYCDLQHASASGDFGFVKLPREYKVDVESGDDTSPLPVRNTRTMGLVGDSIWFVCIDTPSHYTNAVVFIWELKSPGEEGEGWQWKEVDEVSAKMLWELSSFKKAGLPLAPFQYPILTADGALCFVLVDPSSFPRRYERPLVDHFCSFDMHQKRLLWHGLVHNYPITDSVIMYPSLNFHRNEAMFPQEF